jgi:hypothetical protein
MQRLWVFLLSWMGLLGLGGSASAQELTLPVEAEVEVEVEPSATAPAWGAIVLSFGGDATEAMNAEARDGATAGLVAQGFSVLDEAEISARISPARLSSAGSIDALRAIAHELGAESVVSVAVWTSDGAADSVIVSLAPAEEGARSFSATEHVTDTGLGAAAQAATLAALTRRTRAALLGGGSGHVEAEPETVSEGTIAERTTEEHDPWAEEEENPDDAQSLFGIIGPGLLLALGGAGLGLGIYSVLDENCTLRGPVTNVCLQGDGPNVGLGVLLLVGGVLSATGAAVWWITGALTTNEPRVDGIVWQDGGMLRVRGLF